MTNMQGEYVDYIRNEYKHDKLNQSQLYKLGFMKHHVEDLLPTPEIVPNPHFKGRTMKVWKKSDVLAAMEQEAFQYDGNEKYCESFDAGLTRMYQHLANE